MNDMLVKFLKGKNLDNKLVCKTIVSNLVETKVEGIDLERVVQDKLRLCIAQTILDQPRMFQLTSKSSPEHFGKEFGIVTYCFSPREFEMLVKEIFDYGRLSANEVQ